MSVFKSQFSRAIRAHKSDNAVIATPSSFVTSGANSTATAFKLINSAATFLSDGLYPGDVVHNDTTETSATVVSIDSDTQLTLNADIFTTTAELYAVYSMSPQAGLGNTGCNLYIGGAGNVSVVTIGGDIATFFAVPAGTVLPVQVIKLRATSTSATNVMGLW